MASFLWAINYHLHWYAISSAQALPGRGLPLTSGNYHHKAEFPQKHACCRENPQTQITHGSSIRHEQTSPAIIPHGIALRHMQKAVPEASIPPRIAPSSAYPRLLSHGRGPRSMPSPTTSFCATSRLQSVGPHAISPSKTSTRQAQSSGGRLWAPDPFTTPSQRTMHVVQQRRCPCCSRSLRGPPIRGPPSSRPLPVAAEPNVRAPQGLGGSL